MTVCFDYASGGGHCYGRTVVKVVRCTNFLLWQLEDTAVADMRPNPMGSGGAGCGLAYCTTHSGLFSNGVGRRMLTQNTTDVTQQNVV
jgi:hypothetical protein